MNDRYQALVNCIDGVVWQTDRDLCLSSLSFGPNVSQDLRAKVEAVRSILDMVDLSSADGAALKAMLLAGRSVRRHHVDSVIQGHRLRISAQPLVEDGAVAGFLGTITDITEYVADRRALDRALGDRRLLIAAIEASPINVTIADPTRPDMPLAFVNDAFCRTTGYTREEVLGSNCRFLQGPDTDQAVVERIRRAVREVRPLTVEMLNYRKDGMPFWNELSIAPVLSDAGDPIAYIGIQRDVSAERRALENEQTRQRMESLGRLAGGVAHEINNLLQPSFLYLDLIQEALAADDSEAAGQIETLRESARAIRSIVHDILTFARAEDPGASTLINLPPLLGRLARFADGVLPSSVRVRLDMEGADRPFLVALRPTDLQKVVINLCVNAADAMSQSGEIVIQARFGPAEATIDVIDRGRGIPERIVDSIFDPFFTTKPLGTGTGLGLAIVYSIVTAWEGGVTVLRTGPEGTTFRLTIPRVRKLDSEVAA